MSDVQDAIAVAIGGKEAGTLFQGDRRLYILARLPGAVRGDSEVLRRLPVPLPKNGASKPKMTYIPLSEVASLDLAPRPNQMSHENGKRRIVISANVRGRDIGSFVPEAEAAIERQVKIPTGHWVTWGGTFKQLQSATTRLQTVVPVALLLVSILLLAVFNNVKDELLVFTGIPFALIGGILALWLRGIPSPIPATAGFIALPGVAVFNGPVMLSFIRSLREKGQPFDTAIHAGALMCLWPVLMTALVAPLGFVPMAIVTGMEAGVQRLLTTVVIDGILLSTVLTLLVLPVFYHLAYRKDEVEDVERTGEMAPRPA